jgi:hypothetical protein
VEAASYGQTFGQAVFEKPESQLEQAQVATMFSVDHTLPSIIYG